MFHLCFIRGFAAFLALPKANRLTSRIPAGDNGTYEARGVASRGALLLPAGGDAGGLVLLAAELARKRERGSEGRLLLLCEREARAHQAETAGGAGSAELLLRPAAGGTADDAGPVGQATRRWFAGVLAFGQ